MTKLEHLPLTLAVFIAVTPRLPEQIFDARIREIERQLQSIEEFCEEYDLEMPETTLMVDVGTQELVIEHETPADSLRFQQILFKMRSEFVRLFPKGVT